MGIERVALADINLSDFEFWLQPEDWRDGAFADAAQRVAGALERGLPAGRGRLPGRRAGLLVAQPPRRHLARQPQPAPVLQQPGRREHRRHARADRRVLRLDDRDGRPQARPPAGHRAEGLHPEDRQPGRGLRPRQGPHHRRRAARALPGGRVRLRGGGRGTAAAPGHLRDDGHPRGRREAGLRLDQRDPRRRRSRVRADLRPAADHEPRDQPVRHGPRDRPAGQPQGRPHVGPHARRGRRRAPDDPGVRLVLHPARGGRQRDDAQRHLVGA